MRMDGSDPVEARFVSFLLGGAKLICPSSSLGCLERVGRSVPSDGHSGGKRPAGWVGRSVHSDGHSLGERPEGYPRA